MCCPGIVAYYTILKRQWRWTILCPFATRKAQPLWLECITNYCLYWIVLKLLVMFWCRFIVRSVCTSMWKCIFRWIQLRKVICKLCHQLVTGNTISLCEYLSRNDTELSSVKKKKEKKIYPSRTFPLMEITAIGILSGINPRILYLMIWGQRKFIFYLSTCYKQHKE